MKSPFRLTGRAMPVPARAIPTCRSLSATFAGAMLAGALACGAAAAQAASWSIVDLGTLGGPESAALAVSDTGIVLGYSTTANGQPHAFSYRNGVMKDLSDSPAAMNFALAINNGGAAVGYNDASGGARDFPVAFHDGTITVLGQHPGRARGINNAGLIVGDALIGPQNESRAFLYRFGTMIDLGTLGGSSSVAMSINNGGMVAGGSALAGNTASHAFLYDRRSLIDLGTLGGSFSMGYAINERQQVVGESTNSSGDSHAFLWRKSGMTDLGTLGGSFSRALSINNFGQVVGISTNASDPGTRAFLYADGSMTDLNSLPAVKTAGWVLSSANDINNFGQIVGAGVVNGQSHAYLLSPWSAASRHQTQADACEESD